MTQIFVLDTETTGLAGAPDDLVVDIGIVSADLKTGDIEPVFSTPVGYSESMIRKHEGAWVFNNTDLNFWQVLKAPGVYKVASRVSELLTGELVTSYNTEFDLDRFLYRDPWNLKNLCFECNCIMTSAWRAFPNLGRNGFYPKLQVAYDALCPGDPMNVGKQRHRALSDAVMAAHVMMELHKRGKYKAEV